MRDAEDVPGPRRGHLRTRDWTRVSHGLFRPTHDDARAHDDLAAWALVLPPTGAFTHLTAAREYGWWLPPLPEGVPVFASMATTEFRPRRDGLRVSQHPAPIAVVRAGGLTLASPAETLLACARDLRVLDMVVLVDAALHSRSCTREDVVRASAQRRRGAPLLRRVLLHADGRSESAWESVLRMLHRVCDVPVEPQHKVYDGAGSFVARGDLWIIGTRTLHEYDGGEHRTRARQRHDLRRERWLGNEQWQRRGYTNTEILGQANVIIREADASLGREHRPQRLAAWRRLLADSLFSDTGTIRFRARVGLPSGGTRHELQPRGRAACSS